ncbi:Hypothetical protein NGAL_HAMBI1145_09800 [Neorhizobium galegae bv. officinalis]|uniref:Mu-like prophage FluMu N-terminal domain-containing protein n=1 Tax=Neorhizobium galegae bv. officinalis TaxID=323656 RepID=A0A0T7FB92_NEOGA|nr:hypothetical protein [Neorhizobium galegae]CDZ32209.1 Hypothetical protein NGAL_HAMBI1145_09800 [Neorhizobium galegae bv. officinalis]
MPPRTKATAKPAGEETFSEMIAARKVLIVSAPAGPRRRANLTFGPEPRELTEEDLGADPEATINALRADPMLKIDGRYEEIELPAEPQAGEGAAQE